MDRDKKKKLKELGCGGLVALLGLSFYGSLIGLLGLSCYKVSSRRNSIGGKCEVQQGYIAPSRLEIECKDLDQNGELETLMRIDGKPYLLKEVDGNPVISDYEIAPTR